MLLLDAMSISKDDNIKATEVEEDTSNVNVLSNLLSDKSFQSVVMGTEVNFNSSFCILY